MNNYKREIVGFCFAGRRLKKRIKKRGEKMTVIREEEINFMPQIEESHKISEIYDTSRFFIPAEIHISEEKIAW